MENYEDNFWQESIDTLRKWRRDHPAHAPKLYRLGKTIEAMRIQYRKHYQEYFQKQNPYALEKANAVKQDAEALLKKLSKLELLASLSK
jgi:superoxide dismutase